MNILFRLTSLDALTEDQVYERLGKPVKSTVMSVAKTSPSDASAPSYVVERASMLNLDPSLISHDILVVDFGQTFISSSAGVGVGTPAAYAAPEIIFDGIASKASDVWALACTLFHIRAGFDIFESFLGGPDEALQDMVRSLGPLPERWWKQWKDREVYFNEDGTPRQLDDGQLALDMSSLWERVREIGSDDARDETDEERTAWDHRYPQLAAMVEPRHARPTKAEVDCMADMLRAMFTYNTQERSPADAVAMHPWLTMRW